MDAQTSALGYFITPCVGTIMSIVCYLSLPHLVSLVLGSRPTLEHHRYRPESEVLREAKGGRGAQS